ncbi:ZIP family metal transporter [Phaeovibrio sulfidiphilus]|uniref:ZIP family metal transporter n=1 Tax=Phaeovibrio sulfidiphilus TaxID=1220600 RepID=A0A8J7CEB8_9PROT|nr:ZIP family metal transporter [Phaeovibrio sulfidiphilus]MBE1237654.1 ZIP family metal transporter [Phaeovibrio sulfidiphilus]
MTLTGMAVEHPVLAALLATTFTWAMTAAGASSVFFTRRTMAEAGANVLLGFAAGVMLAASFWSLLSPALELGANGDWGETFGFIPAVAGFLLGAAFLRYAHALVPHLHYFANVSDGPPSKLKRTTLLVFAMTLHNIPEGLAVGVAFGAVAAGAPEAGAAALALGIAIQNIPEGAVISLPLHAEGMSRRRAFLWGQGSALVEPLAGVVGAAAVAFMTPILPYTLGFAAGAMIYVVVEEVIPESQTGKHGDLGTLALVAGFAVMMVLDVAFG